ncbi:MAG TPA: EamA family transporter [Leptolyngbyaceae cyanobacterium M33_DOE_097]|uniref:EamA-like transporter family protein n=1 Tax=Oscillatoriales cyanobacterium SpSt-418 TaxID=2282169 RepID=A0A7C3PHY3_9CYAN|nr:EamA family transporter [Leptolyngbyaceae cyanobacterium M33_DOE_097]
MAPYELVLFLISVLTAASGQFLLKLGAVKLGRVSSSNLISTLTNIAFTPELIGGLALYGFGAVFYILLLTRVDLSVAGPAVALVYVFSVVLGLLVFHEPLQLNRVLGLVFIIAGVILLLWQK